MACEYGQNADKSAELMGEHKQTMSIIFWYLRNLWLHIQAHIQMCSENTETILQEKTVKVENIEKETSAQHAPKISLPLHDLARLGIHQYHTGK